MEKKIIVNLKKSCLAIGLTFDNNNHLPIFVGSGFMIDKEGIFVTAAHVYSGLYNLGTELKTKGEKTTFRVFVSQETKDSSKLVGTKIGLGYELPKMTLSKENEYDEHDLDLYVGRVEGNNKYDFLNFMNVSKIDVLDPIMMCGYPMISQSIDVNSEFEKRWSPILQPGIISSLLPTDNTTRPYGIQTNIVGTGGSSGSPIVNYDSGDVVGMAQKVLTAEISQTQQTAKIGLTYGISNYFVADALPDIINKLKSEIDKEGKPKKHLVPNESIVLEKENVHLSDVYKNK